MNAAAPPTTPIHRHTRDGRRSRPAGWALALAGALFCGACGDDATTPTTPTPVIVTDTFSGSINRNGAFTHSFAVATGGTVQATLQALAPDSALTVGLSLGAWNGSSCSILLANDNAIVTSLLTATAGAAGALCVRIYDVGNVVESTTYELLVTHP